MKESSRSAGARHRRERGHGAEGRAAYLLDREGVSRAKVQATLSNKNVRKAGRWSVPLPKVRAMGTMRSSRCSRQASGRRRREAHVSKVHVCEGFTRKPPKYERFIRPTGLRFKKRT